MTAARPEATYRQMHSGPAAGFRLVLFLAWTVIFAPIALLFVLPASRPGLAWLARPYRRVARIYWQGVALILGLRIRIKGFRSDEPCVLYVSNHVSYLDIIVLGSLLPAAFIAKKEVASWPGINIIARLGRTVFVDRRPRKSLDQRDDMQNRLGGVGESLILFPEGTSNDGNRVLAFKSALFSVAETVLANGRSLPVQPISLAYTRLDHMPIGRSWRAFFAWYGDMQLLDHLWLVLGLGRITVDVVYHPVVRLSDYSSRKALADHCHRVVKAGVIAANSGRLT